MTGRTGALPRTPAFTWQDEGAGGASVMRRTLVTQNHTTRALGLAGRFALAQHLDMAGEARDLAILPGDDLGEIVELADEMGDLFFEPV